MNAILKLSFFGYNAAISLSASDIAGTWVRVRFTCSGFDKGTVFVRLVYCTTAITFCIVVLAIVIAWRCEPVWFTINPSVEEDVLIMFHLLHVLS